MRRVRLINLSFLALAVISMSSCGGLKKMETNAGLVKYSVTPNPLEMQADSVAISISGKYPPKYFNKKVTLTATPVLTFNGGEKACKDVKVQGEKVQDNNAVISYTEGGSFSYSDKIPYEEAMRLSKVELRVQGYVKPDKPLDFDPVVIADGVIATPSLLMIAPKPIIGKDKFQRITQESKNADLLFQIQQAKLQSKELNKDQVKALMDYLATVQKNKRKELQGVDISAYASPDGPTDLNAKLSTDRGSVTEKYITKQFKKDTVLDKKETYKVTDTAEDWDGFQKLMKNSTIADKDLVLRVLSMYSDGDQREKEIKNMSKVYLEIADQILPQLRRSVLTVNVKNVGYSDEEITNIFNTKPDSLKPEELLYAATLTKDNNKKLNVYNKFMEIYPKDWRGPNNAGAMNLLLGNTDKAKELFDKAKQLDENNIIIENNFGAVSLLKGNLDKVEEHFVAASGAGDEVNYNLGVLKVKQGDYNSAVTYFGNNCSFDAALAKLLNQDYDGSIKAVDCAPNKDDAMMYYLKAVDGARKADTEIMYNNLRSALEKDASLNKLAKTDMEFFKYFNDDTYKSIVK